LNQKFIVVILILILTSVVFTLRLFPSANSDVRDDTLAGIMSTVISSIDWNSTDYRIVHTGLLFNKVLPSQYEGAMEANLNNTVAMLNLRSLADTDGYYSKNLQNLTLQALANQQMIGHLPCTYSGYDTLLDLYVNETFLIYDRFMADAYGWAKGTVYESKWDVHQATNEIFSMISTPDKVGLYYPYPSSTSYYHDRFGNHTYTNPRYHRYYDDVAETIEFLLALNEKGGQSTRQKCLDIWQWMQNGFWIDPNNYSYPNGFYSYNYLSGSPSISKIAECEVNFDLIIRQLAEINGGLQYFPDRCLSDVSYKLVSNNWSSTLWENYVIRHATDNSQKRITNTLNAFVVMDNYYDLMNSTTKKNFANMLAGTNETLSAWKGLIQSGLYSNGTFSFDGTTSPTSSDTCVGLKLLLLDGIVPETGSLAIPPKEERYEDTESMFSAKNFNFDYDNRTIRIPVHAGSLGFQFGTELTNYTFPSDGVYTLHFSSDWNSIISVNNAQTPPMFPIGIVSVSVVIIAITGSAIAFLKFRGDKKRKR